MDFAFFEGRSWSRKVEGKFPLFFGVLSVSSRLRFMLSLYAFPAGLLRDIFLVRAIVVVGIGRLRLCLAVLCFWERGNGARVRG